ncbi:conjugal transfer protein TrbI [Tolypothrix sp. FACHB-123]|uniref:TrbI/VirB10 family protein n=1 Tax=Tolypothrix sp. FACHB-123 TaxID=2692868 RepID=UPI001689B0F6|nr:TrbI/VirB10 family protein [Tolypothrix sp. FACHB-123]MBD2357649.1 conjugal transfer protein TrbI [Tolypothrix sp. FACHB-123]
MPEHQNGKTPINVLELEENPTTANQKYEQEFNEQFDDEWDEESLARLLGYVYPAVTSTTSSEVNEHEITSEEVEHTENQAEVSSPNVVAPHELFDDPQLGKTQQNFSTNPFSKFGVVGLGLFVIFGVGATFLNIIISGRPKAAPKIVEQGSAQPTVELADNIKPQEVETGKLKAELALGSQVEKIKSLESSKSPKTSVAKVRNQTKDELNKRTTVKQTPPDVRPLPISRPVPVAYVPRQTTPREYYSPRFTTVSRPQPPVSKVPVNTTSTIPISPHTNQSTDPMQQWAAINRLGSYGSSEIATNNELATKTYEQPNNSAVDTVTNRQGNSPIIIPRATPVLAVANTIVETADSLEPLYTEENAIVTGVPVRQLTVGATASGKLITPLIWGERSTNNIDAKSVAPAQKDKFIVQLVEPLTEEDGFVSLPKGTQIVVHVRDIEESGFVQLEATQIVMDGKEYVLPPGAITIRGNSGRPLMASKSNDKGGEIASRDAETFVVGSLAKVGKVLNQPQDEQYSTSTGFGGTTTFSSTRRGGPNILGAVLEGGFEPLTEQILERNKRSLREIEQRKTIWYVRAGSDIQVFVNQSFQF